MSRFGKAPLPAIRVQVEQLRRRLHRFARWQADWAANGWRVEWVEGRRVGCESLPEEREAEIVVDAQPMALHGRIDRVDVQPSTGRRVIIDYKNVRHAHHAREGPSQEEGAGSTLGCRFIATFRRPKSLRPGLGGLTCNCRCTGTWSRAWGSRALLAWPTSCCPRTLVREALLPADWTEADFKDANRVRAALVSASTAKSQWTADHLRQADLAAEEVVRAVRAEKFWPPAEPPPPFSKDFAAICQDNRFFAPPLVEEGDDNP